jgi:hypothetical protein
MSPPAGQTRGAVLAGGNVLGQDAAQRVEDVHTLRFVGMRRAQHALKGRVCSQRFIAVRTR